MKKKTAIEILINRFGYIPDRMIYDIFNDEDDIPEALVNLSLNNKPRQNFIITNASVAEALNSVNKNKN